MNSKIKIRRNDEECKIGLKNNEIYFVFFSLKENGDFNCYIHILDENKKPSEIIFEEIKVSDDCVYFYTKNENKLNDLISETINKTAYIIKKIAKAEFDKKIEKGNHFLTEAGKVFENFNPKLSKPCSGR